MAEGPDPKNWRDRRNHQVNWLIDEIFNSYLAKMASKLSNNKLVNCGDQLDDENLFSSSFQLWQTLKKEKKVDKLTLCKNLKDNSIKTFTTRIIFMELMQSIDTSGIF